METLTYKKYPNRKFYSENDHKYVNLRQILDKLTSSDNAQIKIVDVATNKDITDDTLLSALFMFGSSVVKEEMLVTGLSKHTKGLVK
jgi:polyhydroxyalkanoate synthesis regulator protein